MNVEIGAVRIVPQPGFDYVELDDAVVDAIRAGQTVTVEQAANTLADALIAQLDKWSDSFKTEMKRRTVS